MCGPYESEVESEREGGGGGGRVWVWWACDDLRTSVPSNPFPPPSRLQAQGGRPHRSSSDEPELAADHEVCRSSLARRKAMTAN